MSILSRLRSLFLFAIISFALFVIACKKESSPTPPPPPEKSKVTVSSFQVDDNSKIFLPPFSGKVSGEIYVALIPQTGGAFTGDIILKAATLPSTFSTNMKFMVKNDDGTDADPAVYKLTGRNISFNKPGLYRVSGYVPEGDHNLISDTTRELRIQITSNVPDMVFREKLKQFPGVVFEGEILDTNSAVGPTIPEDWSSSYSPAGTEIQTLEGINYFRNIKSLNCSGNKFTYVDISRLSQLESFECTHSSLTALDLRANSKLTYVYVDYSHSLATLQVSNLHELKNLRFGECNVSNVDLTGLDKLDKLYCVLNPIHNLNLTTTPLLNDLFCPNTQISNLDISSLHNLGLLTISDCPIAQITFDSAANSNPVLYEMVVSHSFKCDPSLKAIKRYRSVNMSIELSDLTSGLGNIFNYDPLVSCP